MIETAGAVRRRRRGTSMTTPVRKVTVTVDGRRETLVPNRDYVHVGHAIVAADPTAFRAARAGDAEVRLRLAQLARARRTRPAAAQQSERPRAPRHLGGSRTWRLGRCSSSRPDWRLSA